MMLQNLREGEPAQMKDTAFCYSIGALLYCPAYNETIADSVIHQKIPVPFSLALCLEDTIADTYVAQAESALLSSLQKIETAYQTEHFYLPKIFIRIRRPGQILALYEKAGKARGLITGFIAPKFSPENAECFIAEILKLNQTANSPVFLMPVLESPSLIDLRTRYDLLYGIKEKLAPAAELVPNIRVGGNDLCHAFGLRRQKTQAIQEIQPVSRILSDIITVFGTEYVVSGPVWEYYGTDGWDIGLRRELELDRLNGFVGKTIIHPKQIPLVNHAYRVSKADFHDARAILNWDPDAVSLVSGSMESGRMNECLTHSNWAKKICALAEAYGIEE